MKRARRQQGKSALDLIEEAVQLLRTAPAGTLAVYYLGVAPFVLGLLFFWADMGRSPFARQHLADASLGMALLFFWMKFWQSVFALQLRAQIAARPAPIVQFRRGARILLAQMILQPAGLLMIPLSLVPVFPFAWVYAFFQNATVMADGQTRVPALLGKCRRQAALWPMQNSIALSVLLAFAFCVFLNWAMMGLVLPQLCKMLFGIQSVFTKSPWSMMNSTFFAVMFGLTYLCVDPILKAFYVLRCFYGESLQSGEDLKSELARYAAPVRNVAALLLLSAIFLFAPARAADITAPANPPNAAQLAPSDLDRAINQTIHERKFTWRMPRENIDDSDANEGVIGKFFDKIGVMLRSWARSTLEWLNKWLNKLFPGRNPASSNSDSNLDWGSAVRLLLWFLVAATVFALCILVYRVWQNRQKPRLAVTAEMVLPVIDIADENVGADQLPEDRWTQLARELLGRGELRLAMRAFYLASLAHLASRNLISIARFKSNREYERELRRRGHSLPELLSTFSSNLSVFEGIWYGTHEVSSDLVSQFAAKVERIRGAA
jgi:hypothetical protein